MMINVPNWALRLVGVLVPGVRSNLAVDAGDLCRDRHDWVGAARHYRRAVRICPQRRPIWVQLGHMSKEAGWPEDALTAYRRASAIAGVDGDAPAHHGEQALATGHFVEAKAAFFQAMLENPHHPWARALFVDMLHDSRAVSDRAIALARELAIDEVARLAGMTHGGVDHDIFVSGPAIVFDISDLVSYFRVSRLPTGIQRVQIEVIRAALAANAFVQVACFSDNAGTWSRVPAAHFKILCDLAVSDGDLLDQQWIDALEVLVAVVASATPAEFTQGGFLVNLGTSWSMHNYFLHVRALQQSHGIHYVPFVHDFIPVIAPEHCVLKLTQDFLNWTQNVFRHADYFLVNSQSTLTDLNKVARILGHAVAPSHVRVVPLDADFRRPGLTGSSPDRLAQWDLEPDGYVLFVSTIESRKNHLSAFRAWQGLISKHGAQNVPDLVCVGNRGWLNDHVYAALADDPLLSTKVRMLSHVSDEDLALLYGRCRFTIYPSAYEGWGLPVTESLCFGKVPLLSRNASLPEAGGDFAVYADPADRNAMIAALEMLAFDTEARSRLELHIQESFRARTWSQLATQINDDLAAFAVQARSSPERRAYPAVEIGKLYRFSRNRRTRLARDADEGEQFRSGYGWWEPGDSGCATRIDGGTIAMGVVDNVPAMQIWLRLRGPLGAACDATIVNGSSSLRAALLPDQWQWISFLARSEAGHVTFHVRGNRSAALATETRNRDNRVMGVEIGGLIALPFSEGEVAAAAVAAQALADTAHGDFRFLRDIFLLLLNREIDAVELEDYLPLLETGQIKREDVISWLYSK